MKKRKIGDKALTKKVDHAFRQLFKARTKEMKCFVCGRETDWWDKKTNPNGLQLGHFISRSVFTLRWDEDNCFPQCSGCNKIHENNTLPFTWAVVSKLGPEHIDLLNTRWQVRKAIKRSEKILMIEKLQLELSNYDK